METLNPLPLKKRFVLWQKTKICFVCLAQIETPEEVSIEHVIPRSLGGTNGKWNLSVSHKRCNNFRGSKLCRLTWYEEINKLKFQCKIKVYQRPHTFSESNRTRRHLGIPVTFWRKDISYRILNDVFAAEFSSFWTGKPGNEQDSMIPILKDTIQTLIHAEDIISSSRILDLVGVRTHWKLIFGMVFLKKFFETSDIRYYVFGIWRLDQYMTRKPYCKLNESLEQLMSYCWKLQPEAYDRYQSLKKSL